MKTVKALRARRILTLADAQPAARRNDLPAPFAVLDSAAKEMSEYGIVHAGDVSNDASAASAEAFFSRRRECAVNLQPPRPP